jgi:PST family polysaccharide transporter
MRRLARDSFVLVNSNILGAMLAFALSLVIGRELGAADFGRWTFSLAWASAISMICEFGLNSLLTREGSRAPLDSNRLLFASLTAQLTFAGTLGVGVWIFSPLLSPDAETSTALRIAVFIAFAGIIYGSFTAVFRSFRWMWPILWLNVIGLMVQLAWSIWILSSGGKLLGLIWVALIVDLGQVLAAFLLWWVRIKQNGGPILISLPGTINMIRQAIPFAVAGAFAAIQMRSTVMMIAYLRNVSDIGLFGAALRWSESAKIIPNGIFGALYPAFATERGADYFRRVNPMLQGLATCLTLVLCLLARPILTLSYGSEYIHAAPVLIWLGVGIFPSLLNGSIETYLYAVGDEKYATKLRAMAVVVQVGIGLMLVYFWGATGAAISIALGEIAILLPLRRRIKIIMR